MEIGNDINYKNSKITHFCNLYPFPPTKRPSNGNCTLLDWYLNNKISFFLQHFFFSAPIRSLKEKGSTTPCAKQKPRSENWNYTFGRTEPGER